MPRKRTTSPRRRFAWSILGTAYLALLVAVGAGAGSWQTPEAPTSPIAVLATR